MQSDTRVHVGLPPVGMQVGFPLQMVRCAYLQVYGTFLLWECYPNPEWPRLGCPEGTSAGCSGHGPPVRARDGRRSHSCQTPQDLAVVIVVANRMPIEAKKCFSP